MANDTLRMTAILAIVLLGPIGAQGQRLVPAASDPSPTSLDRSLASGSLVSFESTVADRRGSAVPVCPGPAPWMPLWYAQADALFLQRTAAEELATAIIPPGNGMPVVVQSTDDLDTGMSTGIRVTMGRQLGVNHVMEASYFGLNYWSASNTITDPNGDLYSVPFGNGMTSQTISSASRLHNAEFNIRRIIMPGGRLSGSWLTGFRYINFGDSFVFSPEFLNNNNPFSTIAISTNNNLVGGQLGGDLTMHATPRFRMSAKGKAGLFANFNSMDGSIESQDIGNLAFSDDKTRLSAVFDVGVNGTWRATQHLALRGGYDVIYVAGLALGSDNFDVPGILVAPRVMNNGEVIFYGPSAGLEFLW